VRLPRVAFVTSAALVLVLTAAVVPASWGAVEVGEGTWSCRGAEGPPWLATVGTRVEADAGAFSLGDPRYRRTLAQRHVQDAVGTGWEYVVAAADAQRRLDLTLTVRELSDGAVAVRLRLGNTSDQDLTLNRIILAEGLRPYAGGEGPRAPGCKVLCNGFHSWDSVLLAALPPPAPGAQPAPAESWYTVAADTPPLVAGFLTNTHNYNHFRVAALPEGLRVTAIADCDGCRLPAGMERETDWLWLSPAPDPLAGLEAYAALAGKLARVRIWEPNFATWCSWYAGWIRDTPGLEEGVKTNAPLIARELAPYGADCLRIVDDSTGQVYGDWPDKSWNMPAEGMAAAASRLQALGLRPGVWVVPYAAAEKSQVAQHLDWMQRDAAGNVVRSDFYGNPAVYFDSSHAGTTDYFRQLFGQIHDWGYRYVMTDFLLLSGVGTQYHDRRMTKAEVYRHGLEAIRAALGDDTYWLACGAPLGPAMGLVDGMRIGPDSFGNNVQGYLNAAGRYYFHRRAWLNDPDAIVLRGHTPEWNRAWVSWIALSGSVVTYGDRLQEMEPGQLELLRRAWPPLNAAGRPLDLFDREQPLVWDVALNAGGEPYHVLGIFHWDQSPLYHAAVNLDRVWAGLPARPGAASPTPQRYVVWDFWNEQCLGEVEGALSVPLPSAGGAVYGIRPALGRPQLLATTRHIGQGVAEIEELSWEQATGTLRGTSRGVAGRNTEVVLYVPAAWEITEVHPGTGRNARPTPEPVGRAGVVRFAVSDGNGAAQWVVRCRRVGVEVREEGARPPRAGPVLELRVDADGVAAERERRRKLLATTYADRVRAVTPEGHAVRYFVDCGSTDDLPYVPELGFGYVEGAPWTWQVDLRGSPPSAATVRFGEQRVAYRFSGLDPERQYCVGVLWWDADGTSRQQSLTIAPTDPAAASAGATVVLPAQDLPSGPLGEPAQWLTLDLPAALVRTGDLTVASNLAAGINAVLSEVWVFER